MSIEEKQKQLYDMINQENPLMSEMEKIILQRLIMGRVEQKAKKQAREEAAKSEMLANLTSQKVKVNRNNRVLVEQNKQCTATPTQMVNAIHEYYEGREEKITFVAMPEYHLDLSFGSKKN